MFEAFHDRLNDLQVWELVGLGAERNHGQSFPQRERLAVLSQAHSPTRRSPRAVPFAQPYHGIFQKEIRGFLSLQFWVEVKEGRQADSQTQWTSTADELWPPEVSYLLLLASYFHKTTHLASQDLNAETKSMQRSWCTSTQVSLWSYCPLHPPEPKTHWKAVSCSWQFSFRWSICLI